MPKKITERKCTGCGQMKDKRQLVRIVRSPDGVFSVDMTGKAAGRGAYICRDRSCLEAAKKNHGLERSFGQKISDDIYRSLAEELDG